MSSKLPLPDAGNSDALSPLIDRSSPRDESAIPSSLTPPDAGKDVSRTRSDSALAEDFTHKLKIHFADRTYRNILCSERVTTADVKRRLMNRMQLPKDYTLQLIHASIDGSNLRVLFDSEFLQAEELRQDEVKAATDHRKACRTYVSSASLSIDVTMVYLAKLVPCVKEGEQAHEFTSASMGRGFLSRRKPTSTQHRRYFFQLWRVKKMLALFKTKDEVHSVILLNGSYVHADSGNEYEFLLRVPGEGDYSFIAESRMERDDWMWVLGGVDLNAVTKVGSIDFSVTRRMSVSSAVGKRGDVANAMPGSQLVRSRSYKQSSLVFEGILHKSGLGMGKSFFQPRRVRIHNGMLITYMFCNTFTRMYYKTGQDNAHPSGVIMLKHCQVSSFVRPGTSEPYGFIVNSLDRDYQFATSDSSERDRWMTAILAICSTQSALSQQNASAVAFELQPLLPQVVSIKAIVEKCLDYFKGKKVIDIETQPWFGDFSAHMGSVVEVNLATLMIESNPVRVFLSERLRTSATVENCQLLISICLQQLIMPAILPELPVQLGFPHGQFEPLIEHFAAKCRLVLEHPNIFESLNLPSRECSYEMGIKLMSKMPLLTDPHAILSSLLAVIESAQSDLKVLMGPRAPVLTGDHIFCFLLYFILKADPAPHHLLSEVVSLLNSPFDLQGPRGYISATYCAAVSYIMSFSSSLQRKTDAEFLLAAKGIRHTPSKRFTKRLGSVAVGAADCVQPPTEQLEQPLQGALDALPPDAVLAAADVDVTSSDDEVADEPDRGDATDRAAC